MPPFSSASCWPSCLAAFWAGSGSASKSLPDVVTTTLELMAPKPVDWEAILQRISRVNSVLQVSLEE